MTVPMLEGLKQVQGVSGVSSVVFTVSAVLVAGLVLAMTWPSVCCVYVCHCIGVIPLSVSCCC